MSLKINIIYFSTCILSNYRSPFNYLSIYLQSYMHTYIYTSSFAWGRGIKIRGVTPLSPPLPSALTIPHALAHPRHPPFALPTYPLPLSARNTSFFQNGHAPNFQFLGKNPKNFIFLSFLDIMLFYKPYIIHSLQCIFPAFLLIHTKTHIRT